MVMTTISTPSRLRRFLSAWAGVSESVLLVLLMSSMVKRGAIVQIVQEAGIRDHLELIDEIDRIPIGFYIP